MEGMNYYSRSLIAIMLMSAWIIAGASPERTGKIYVNSLGMPMVRIPAGEFLMGSDEPVEKLANAFPLMGPDRLSSLTDEAPVHSVRITRDFYIGQTEVTVGQFRRFLAKSRYVPESIADGTGAYGYNAARNAPAGSGIDKFEGRDPRFSWANTGFKQTDRHPVVNVTWNDAQALARWLSAQEGRNYRLPTEAEWEYAARAGTRTRYHHGDDPEQLVEIANIFDASAAPHWPDLKAFALQKSDGFAFTSPVASKRPNGFGLYDMHGNVWEWTSDFYGADYYAHSPSEDPQGPLQGDVRVRRGGSWHSWPLYSRSSYRNWNSEQTRYTLVGIRLVMEVMRK